VDSTGVFSVLGWRSMGTNKGTKGNREPLWAKPFYDNRRGKEAKAWGGL